MNHSENKSNSEFIISLRGVTSGYPNAVILKDVNLRVRFREIDSSENDHEVLHDLLRGTAYRRRTR
jgi:ABC-type transporter Mla maintaining outer membrane lipid asymmetry ATPase subunit MlaF